MKKNLLLLSVMLVPVFNTVNAQNWLPDPETPSVYEPDEYGTVTDYDGNVYKTARFGDTWWMLENLRNTHYNDGKAVGSFVEIDSRRPIDGETTYYSWFAETASYAFPNHDESNVEKYGLLYTWSAATNSKNNGKKATPKFSFNVNGGLLPVGWKVADTTAWYDLSRRMQSEEVIIGKWITNSGSGATAIDSSFIQNIGLFLKKRPGEGWEINESLPSVDDIRWNKSELNLVAPGIVGGNVQEDNTVEAPGFDFDTWIWTDHFVHADSAGNGRRYAYFTAATNDLQITNRSGFNHATVRGIMRVERTGGDSGEILKVGSVSSTDEILVYPNSTSDVFSLLSVKETSYERYSSGGSLSRSGLAFKGGNTIDISKLAAGMYLLKTDGYTFKIIKK